MSAERRHDKWDLTLEIGFCCYPWPTQMTNELPDDLAQCADPARAALEARAIKL